MIKKLTRDNPENTNIIAGVNIYPVSDLESNPKHVINEKLESMRKYLDRY